MYTQHTLIYRLCTQIEIYKKNVLDLLLRKDGPTHQVFRDIFQLYCALGPGVTVKDICTRFNPHALKIDERKLIQFGLMKGLIRRLQKYPIKIPGDVTISVKLQQLYPWFNGRHSYDEICTKTGLSHQDLEERIEADPSIVVSWK